MISSSEGTCMLLCPGHPLWPVRLLSLHDLVSDNRPVQPELYASLRPEEIVLEVFINR